MNKQLIFFLILSSLFLIKGTISTNLIMQFMGIVLLLFLIYDYIFNHEENKKYKKNYTNKINFIRFLGNIDLSLGILLLVRVLYGIIPIALILFLVIILFLKAFIFIWGGDITSMIDIIFSIIILSSNIIEIPLFIMIGISIYLIQKGILSFIC